MKTSGYGALRLSRHDVLNLPRQLGKIPVHPAIRSYGVLPESGEAPDFLDIVERFGRVGYWHIDLRTDEVFFSTEVCDAHGVSAGYRPDSLAECVDWYLPEDRELVSFALTRAMNEAEPFAYEARLKTAQTEIRWVSVSGEVRCSDEGTPIALIGALRDVTAERFMNDRLAVALKEAKSANRLKDTFLANMSHELRTPLNAIIGFSQLINMKAAQGEVNEQIGEYAKDISNAGGHLLAIIEDIFSLAQMEAQAETMTLEPIGVAALLDDVRSLTGTLARENGQRIHFGKSPCGSCRIVADKAKMTKILVNLVSNAIKYSPAGAPIHVYAEVGEGGRVFFNVIDKGPGIPEHLHEKIFERFERLEACKHAIEGIGVGLAIARDLVASMNGDIGVISKEGEGSTFWLAFDQEQRIERAVAV